MRRLVATAALLAMTAGCGTLGSLGNRLVGDDGKAIVVKNHSAIVVNARPESLEINAVARLVKFGGSFYPVICVGEMERTCDDWEPYDEVWLNEARQEQSASEIVFEMDDRSICGDRICAFRVYYLLDSGRKAR